MKTVKNKKIHIRKTEEKTEHGKIVFKEGKYVFIPKEQKMISTPYYSDYP